MSDRRYRLVGDRECILDRIEQREKEKIAGYLEKAGKVRCDYREKYDPSRPVI